MVENRIMTPAVPVMLGLAILATASAPSPLPRGSADFRLGVFRAQVDSAVAARQLPVISNGSAYLVCGSDDPRVEYEQYSFFQAPHGIRLLWKITIGYHLGASRGDLDTVLTDLRELLGEPSSDTGGATGATNAAGELVQPPARQVIWADPSTAVQLAARWGDGPPHPADRMMVTWTDRRLQRLIDARRKNGKSADGE